MQRETVTPMRVVKPLRELQALADAERVAGLRVALVPTMGALHAGHLALCEVARKAADRVWVSIFVNPTQFNDVADLEGYPRSLAADLEACRGAGVDVVFCPSADEMYPAGAQTTVEVTELAKPLCGATRPGHFRGVTTIVSKLLLAAKPHVALFGEKDYQQLAVVRRMVRDLGFDVEILGVPTVREFDGVALSSRNLRLTREARQQATALVRGLDAAESAVAAGERDAASLLERVRHEIEKASLAQIDYAELRDPDSLAPATSELEEGREVLLALAVFFPASASKEGDSVRLIDNRLLRPQKSRSSRPNFTSIHPGENP